MILWNREVNSLMTDLKQEKNLISLYSKLFKKILISEVNKAYGFDVRVYREKSDMSYNKHSVDLLEHQTSFTDLSLDSYHNSPLYIYDKNMLSLGLGVNNVNDTKTSILEDVYTFDFQARYFIEQLSVILLDGISNEYSIFYVNDTQFPVSQTYQIIENHIVQTIEYLIHLIFRNFIQSCFKKLNKVELIRFFRNSDLFNGKLINRTKKRLHEVVCNNIVQMCEQELSYVYEEYLTNNLFNKADAELYIKSFDYSREKSSKVLS
jgi:hypothetical protein